MKNAVLIICFMVALAGCKKGDTGTPGTNGTNGNANVSTVIFTNQSFTYVPSVYQMTLTVPAITQAVVSKGSVNVYFRQVPDTTGWAMLPSFTVGIDATYGLQKVILWSSTAQPPVDVKVVVIPAP